MRHLIHPGRTGQPRLMHNDNAERSVRPRPMPLIRPISAAARRQYLNAALGALLASAGVTLLALPLMPVVDLVNIALLYLLNVVLVAVWRGRAAAIVAAIVGSLLFAHVFVPPLFSLEITDPSYLITAIEMLLVALLAGHLTASLGQRADEAAQREHMLGSIYTLAADLAGASDQEQALRSVSHFLALTPGRSAHALLLHDETRHGLHPWGGGELPSWIDTELAHQAMESKQIVTRQTDDSVTLYFPLTTLSECQGVIGIACTRDALEPLERRRFEMLASLVAVTLARVRYAELARTATLKAEAEQLRSSILSALSHDIRTPLTSVVGLSDALSHSQPPLAPHQREMALELNELAGQMNGLVANLLDMARLQTGRLRLRREWQPLEEVVGVSLEQIRRRFPGRIVRVSLPADLPLLEFDTVLIERVICNLLENALKFAPEGEVRLEASIGDAAVSITVLDDGPGIPPAAEERIFEPFVQGKQESAMPGVGLGLAICRSIVAAHDGTIRAENRREGGARISFTLPRGTPPDAEEAPAEEGSDA